MANELITDTFTETLATDLEDHTPDSGSATGWGPDPSFIQIAASSAGYCASTAGTKVAGITGTFTESDYYTEATFNLGGTTASQRFAIYVRGNNTGVRHGYRLLIYGTSFFRLHRYVSGASDATIANLDGEMTGFNGAIDHTLKLQAEGTGATVTINAWLDGSQVVTNHADTDANRITTVGYPGFEFESTSEQLKNFEAYDLTAASSTVIPSNTQSVNDQFSVISATGLKGAMT